MKLIVCNQHKTKWSWGSLCPLRAEAYPWHDFRNFFLFAQWLPMASIQEIIVITSLPLDCSRQETLHSYQLAGTTQCASNHSTLRGWKRKQIGFAKTFQSFWNLAQSLSGFSAQKNFRVISTALGQKNGLFFSLKAEHNEIGPEKLKSILFQMFPLSHCRQGSNKWKKEIYIKNGRFHQVIWTNAYCTRM